VDGHVGQRLRIRRTLLGMSQEKLGEAIGLTFQQVQKYERGSNRISAGTLFRLGQVLDVPVNFFFDGFTEDGRKPAMSADSAFSAAATDSINRRDARLLRLWRAAPAPVADEILALLAALAPHADAAPAEPAAKTDGAEPLAAATDATANDGADDAAVRRQRRRHGAVWDPADIYSSNRSHRK
jgi:transcriptional regulator with XRE-family HTH domain